jgi:hypothetical protein
MFWSCRMSGIASALDWAPVATQDYPADDYCQ